MFARILINNFVKINYRWSHQGKRLVLLFISLHRRRVPLFCASGGGCALAGFALWSKESKLDAGAKTKENVITVKADAFYDNHLFDDLYVFLKQHSESNDPQVLWRLARAAYEKAKVKGIMGPERKHYIFEAWGFIVRAMQIPGADEIFAVHKWYGILLNATSSYYGTKGQLTDAPRVKQHWLRAVELNPMDATSWYLLGEWCYTLADLSWASRKVASVIFTKPPESSFQEALDFFLKAEEVQPNFYSKNLLMLGKTYLKLGQPALAIPLLQRARDYPVATPDDIEAHEQAEKLLREHKL